MSDVLDAWLATTASHASEPTTAPDSPAHDDPWPSAPTPESLVSWSGRLTGLDESVVWREISPALGLDDHPAAGAVTQYVFTAMLDNAIDHSNGTRAEVDGWLTGTTLSVRVRDDGVGVFKRLAEGKELPDLFAAVQDLTKGRQTTAPDRHTGEGIFFSSKAVELFRLEANAIGWTVDNVRADQSVSRSSIAQGTLVTFEVDLRTDLKLRDLFAQFTRDFEFTRTRPTVKLFGIGVTFVSRSEAKRLLTGMDTFTEVDVDFAGVEGVGQGFVDELFRVWPADHPSTTLTPINMNEAVEFMLRRGLHRPA